MTVNDVGVSDRTNNWIEVMAKRYVVAVDGSEAGWKALDMAAGFAGEAGAALTVVHVVAEEPIPESIEIWAETEGLSRGELAARFHQNRAFGDAVISEARRRLGEAAFDRVEFQAPEGNVAGELVKIAKDSGAEMIILGSRGLSDLQGLLMGSVSHKVTHLAPCTCVVVR